MKAFSRLAIIATMLFVGTALAYDRNYPPYLFKDGAPEHIKAELLVDYKKTEYESEDGQVQVKLIEETDGVSLMIRDGKIELNTLVIPYARAVYWVDLDNNGLRDFIVLYISRANGLGLEGDTVEIFLKAGQTEYRKISYEATYAGIEDFVDLDKDGDAEVIITGFYRGSKHNYLTYSIYEFEGLKLFNADDKYNGFPKFIWFTFEPNDQDTENLTTDIRSCSVKEKDRAISYPKILH